MLEIVKTFKHLVLNELPIQISNTGQIVINTSDYSFCINQWNEMKMNDDGLSCLNLPNLILPVIYNGCLIDWCLGRYDNDIYVDMVILDHEYNKQNISLPIKLSMKIKVIVIIYVISILFIHL